MTDSIQFIQTFAYNLVSSSPIQMKNLNAYIVDSSGLVSLILPVESSFGDQISVIGRGTGGWRIIQGNDQLVHIGNLTSTTGSSGSISSTDQFDSLRLICIDDNFEWTLYCAPQSAGLTIT